MLADRSKFVIGQVPQFHASCLCLAHARTGQFVRHSKRHSLFDEPLGNICSQRETLWCKLRHSLEVQAHCGDHSGNGRQQHVKRVDLIKDRFLIFLQVSIISQRDSFEDAQQRREVTDHAPGLASSQFGHVGILLLRHDR